MRTFTAQMKLQPRKRRVFTGHFSYVTSDATTHVWQPFWQQIYYTFSYLQHSAYK